jgi:lipopolysaccharide exporter
MFRFALFVTSSHLVAFALGLHWGVVGVATAYAISTTLVEPWQTVLAARCLGVSPAVFFRAVGSVFVAAGGMCAVVVAVRAGLVDAGVAPVARLAACIAVGVVVYTGLCLWRVPQIAQEVRALLHRRRTGRALVAAAPAES